MVNLLHNRHSKVNQSFIASEDTGAHRNSGIQCGNEPANVAMTPSIEGKSLFLGLATQLQAIAGKLQKP